MRVGNVTIFEKNVKKLAGMITGYVDPESSRKKSVQGDINIDKDMAASTRIGKYRDNQEDAVLIMKHHLNPDYKIMCVADGVGGNDEGEFASHTAVSEMKKWFNELEMSDFRDKDTLLFKLYRVLNTIHFKIQRHSMQNKNAGAASTTFVCAIVAEGRTYIVNIGDSRAYKFKKGKLTQLTKDDSLVNEMYERGYLKNKDDMRFVAGKNYIKNVLGGQSFNVTPTITECKNEDYDALLLFSDGVTDCLSDDKIRAITKKSLFLHKKDLAKWLVDTATETDSRRAPRADDNPDVVFTEEIKGGKDNTTAAVLFNKNKGKDKKDER